MKERIKTFICEKKISQRAFESRCGLSNGYLRQLRHSPSVDKIEMIISAFPELSKDWLMYGEGDMLNSNVRQTSSGENSPNIAGNGNSVNSCAHTIDKALEEIAEQRKLVTKSQEQIDRLLAIIEQITKK